MRAGTKIKCVNDQNLDYKRRGTIRLGEVYEICEYTNDGKELVTLKNWPGLTFALTRFERFEGYSAKKKEILMHLVHLRDTTNDQKIWTSVSALVTELMNELHES